MNSTKTILVTGATGRQGGAVLRHLRPRGFRLRALSRDPGSHAARALAAAGVEVVRGDLEDPASIDRAVAGASGVFGVQDFWAVGARREVSQGKNLIDAAKKAGVAHFVYSSVGGAERKSGVVHFESKWKIEEHLRASGLPATILRPVAFMETYYIQEVELGLLQGKLTDPVRPDRPNQTIATDDIGAFAALAFDRPAEFIGLALEIAGSELTNPQTAEVFSRVLGRPVKFQQLPMAIVRLFLGKEFFQMFRWFNEHGFQADVAGLRRKYPELHLHSLEEWLRAEGWHKRGLRFRVPRDA